jgi:outer membrane immunogenic protein
MKNGYLVCVALAALVTAGTAQAADVNVASVNKAPPPIGSSWTGFYAGLGAGFRTSRTDLTTTSATFGTPPTTVTLVAPSQPFDGTGFRVAPYVGFNWQFAPRWVAGIEGDAAVASQTTTRAGFASSPGREASFDNSDSLAVKATWDASLRLRLGYLLTPATMMYGTGGVAWQHFQVKSTCAGLGCGQAELTPAVITDSRTRTGWTLGGGLETAVGDHWLLRVEYRYADFGEPDSAIVRTTPFSNSPLVDNFDVAVRTHTATFGLAYKFGDPIASGDSEKAFGALAADRQPAVMPWSGSYFGAALGARVSRADLTTTSLTLAGISLDLAGPVLGQPFDGTALRASPYLGYNWRFARRWIVGIESDFGLARQSTEMGGLEFSPAAFGGNSEDVLAMRTTWDASLRGRLGFLLTPATLAYATGGVAFQHYDVISTCASSNRCQSVSFSPAVVENSATKTGWTIGGGLETALSGHWLARGEYRYADFGTRSFTIARSSDEPELNPTVNTFDVKLRTHTLTFGLAYQFN